MVAPPRLDVFPYRHRVRELMSAPAVAVDPQTPLAAAAARMSARGISSLLVAERGDVAVAARILGIVTERDLVRALGAQGAEAAGQPVGAIMTAPVQAIAAEALAHVAIGRMQRLGVRHLVVTEADGQTAGMISARALLKMRAGAALPLGDQIAAADGPEDLAAVTRSLPALAEGLLAEGLGAGAVAAVISGVVRDLTARAGQMAAADLGGRLGSAPAPWCLLVLGSGGRGESLLAADQDNALVHAAPDDAPWFQALGEQVAATLDAAGIPLCKGGVMARNREWRRNPGEWRAAVEAWVRERGGAALLNVDIFFDFQPVEGDGALAADLRRDATRRARASPHFLRLLAGAVADHTPPLGLFGGFRLRGGRLDLKIGALLPIVAGTRVLALGAGVTETGTRARLAALAAAGVINDGDRDALSSAHECLLTCILRQQIADLAAGRLPGTHVDPARLGRDGRRALKAAIRAAAGMATTVNDALSVRPPVDGTDATP